MRSHNYGDVDKLGDLSDQPYSMHDLAAEVSQPKDRLLEHYQKFLDFNPEEYRGKRVLDVGSGMLRTFAAEAENHGVQVVSLSPAFRSQRWLSEISSNLYRQKYIEQLEADIRAGKVVEAVAQDIPLPSDLP
ncbi:hypothetical protein KW794_03000, partial [Candidatus Saccharibacteria bacterium]|nr:hypothetical protein [Candidatus Saccharibacteria bacterium]